MIDSFDILFSKILIKNSKIKWKKEILFGMLLSILFIVFFFISRKYTKLCILSFFIFTSFASFLKENQIFMVYDDFKFFDLDINSFRFFKIYIIQRFFKDSYVSNLILFFIVSIFLIIRDVQSFIWLLIVLIVYILLMPVNHRIGVKNANMIFFKVIVDLAIIAALIIGVINNFDYAGIVLNEPENIKSLVLFSILALVITITLFGISLIDKKYESSDKSMTIYKCISWIKKIDIEIYKDYLLNFQSIVISIISIIVLFFIIKDVNDKSSIVMTVIFVIAPTGIFTKKTKQEYDIMKFDHIFLDSNLSDKDIYHIKLSKLKTISTEIIIKLVLAILLLAVCGGLKYFYIIFDVFIIAVISAMIHFIIIIKNSRFTSVYINIVKYTLVVVGLLNIYGSINKIVFLIYMLFVFVLTFILMIDVLKEGEKNNEEGI